jgi:hypothetical protein
MAPALQQQPATEQVTTRLGLLKLPPSLNHTMTLSPPNAVGMQGCFFSSQARCGQQVAPFAPMKPGLLRRSLPGWLLGRTMMTRGFRPGRPAPP